MRVGATKQTDIWRRPPRFPELGEFTSRTPCVRSDTWILSPHFPSFFEMTPFRKPKRTAFRKSKVSATPERPGNPSRSGVRTRPETPSPRSPDGETPADVTAAAAKNDGCGKTPEAPAPARHESAVGILPFSFVVHRRNCTLIVRGWGGSGAVTVFAGAKRDVPGRSSVHASPRNNACVHEGVEGGREQLSGAAVI